jgi:hypothetical protein
MVTVTASIGLWHSGWARCCTVHADVAAGTLRYLSVSLTEIEPRCHTCWALT